MDKPVGKISRTAWMDAPETLKLMAALCGAADDTGDEARFVGGCVRDAVLNVKSFDIDIATAHLPDEVIRRLKAHKIKAVPTGIEHGTVTAVVDDKIFEITTLRRDVKTDGRHAEVAFTNKWHEDAARRDFTFNALYSNIKGEIYDYFGGLQDAREGAIRFIRDPDSRIQEDYLRILRFYRFAARFARLDHIDPKAREACRRHAASLENISAERIQSEIIKLLTAKHAADVWHMMLEDGIIAVILPQAMNIDNFRNLINLEIGLECESDPVRHLAALIGFDTKAAASTASALKLSNHDKKKLADYAQEKHEYLLTADTKEIRKAVYLHGADYVRSALLLTADI